MARVHFYSPSLDRNFTFDEWTAYLREHPNAREECVARHKTFEFNVHGVCLNPEVPIMESERGWGFKVQVAQSPNGRWSASHHYFCSDASGGALPVFLNRNEGYKTKAEAINEELMYIIERFTNNKAPAEAIKRAKQKRCAQVVIQQTLF